ncbi:hypothetical protein NJT12_03245 [Flavobacterium sp. AC]|uniref:Uncharacterized protein n=1 Tax=Flavobacterium azizsancarii TaxID=2961580 RepID=A0ABT4W8P9_9FLAO|nr:hypothetical protein [Flavobacterium azizsancarii]MDA6068627.1 hypothetical protein [Flavobacterium azizsancarii]
MTLLFILDCVRDGSDILLRYYKPLAKQTNISIAKDLAYSPTRRETPKSSIG